MARSYSRPKFVREESWRLKRIKESWRSPQGKTSRVRRGKKGWPAVVKMGYARATAGKGLHPSGFEEVRVWRPKDLEGVNPKTQVARIGHTVGEKKRVVILEEAKKLDIRVVNAGRRKRAAPGAATEPVAADEPDETPSRKSTAEGNGK